MFIQTHKDGRKIFGSIVQAQMFKRKLSTTYVEDKLYKHVKIHFLIYNGQKGLSCVRDCSDKWFDATDMTANLTYNKIAVTNNTKSHAVSEGCQCPLLMWY